MGNGKTIYNSARELLEDRFPDLHLLWGIPNGVSKGSKNLKDRTIEGITEYLFETHPSLLNRYSKHTISTQIGNIIKDKIPNEEREKRRITTARLGIRNKPKRYDRSHYDFVCEKIEEGFSVERISELMSEEFGGDFNYHTVYHIYIEFSGNKLPARRKANYDLEIKVGNETHTIFEYMRQRYTLEKALYGESFDITYDKISDRVNRYLEKHGYQFKVSRVNFYAVLRRREREKKNFTI